MSRKWLRPSAARSRASGTSLRSVHIRPGSQGTLEPTEAQLAAHGLPPDLLKEVARRLELASLVLGAAYGLTLLLNNALSTLEWYAVPHRSAHNLIGAGMVGLSALVVWLSRSGRIGPARLIDLGLLYEVLVAFGISLQDNLAPLSPERPLHLISWLCVWIVMFPLAVPASPVKTLLASLVAASTWPLAFAVGLAMGNPSPGVRIVVLNLLENYIAAVLALAPTMIVRKLAADVQKARQMGSYELVERLGGGGMGEVWRARHKMLARPAAIKLIRAQSLGLTEGHVAEELRRRFEREAQATAALHSPHTIELYDFGVTRDGTFYYVMEILDGLDLERLVDGFGPVPPERAVHLLVQACDSLADAHYAGMVHRDVKPANIYACRKGLKHDFVKVLDFGLVRAAWMEKADARLTKEGVVAGTPAYMAPEALVGDRPVDARADLYALGCVGYWLLTGRRVFEGATPMEVALDHVRTPPVPPSKKAALTIPGPLEEAILWCLEKEPDSRPASAEELAARLSECAMPECWTQERARRWWDAHPLAP